MYRTVLQLLILLIEIARIQAYAIDASCKPFTETVGDQLYQWGDKSEMIRSAMEEAKKMAALGRDKIQVKDEDDNSREELFRFHSPADLEIISGYFDFVHSQVPWVETESTLSATDEKLTIFCGDSHILPVIGTGNQWVDSTRALTFIGPPHIESSQFACLTYNAVVLNEASQPDGSTVQEPFNLLILCHSALVRGSATDIPNHRSRATTQELMGGGELTIPRHISSIGNQMTLSWVLMHELFHVVLTETITKGEKEKYGWETCTGMITVDSAKTNGDSLAFFALINQINSLNPDFVFIDGVLSSRQALQAQRAAQQQQQQQQQ